VISKCCCVKRDTVLVDTVIPSSMFLGLALNISRFSRSEACGFRRMTRFSLFRWLLFNLERPFLRVASLNVLRFLNLLTTLLAAFTFGKPSCWAMAL
jgi:hypothetical protein